MTHWRDRSWKYHPAAETATPGYLRRRFAQIRKQQEAQKKEQEEKVTKMTRKVKA